MIRSKNIFLLTGQGTQYPGMARSLYESEPLFRQWMDDLDQVPRQKISRSVVATVYGGGKPDALDTTSLSHPALCMVQYALARTLMADGIAPDCILGASLGEYVGLALAGVMPPHAALGALMDNALILENCCRPGTMIGVSDAPRRFDNEPEFNTACSLAGVISPKQFVVSGELHGINRVIRHLEQTRTPFQHLPIRFGFHSPNIDPAEGVWKKRLKAIVGETGGLNPPGLRLLSCCTATFLLRPEIDLFWEIGRRPILFRRALHTLKEELKEELDRQVTGGSSGAFTVNFIDLGPGSHATGFVRQNGLWGKGIRLHRIMTLFNNDMRNLNNIRAKVTSR